jgi:hypothetical protein
MLFINNLKTYGLVKGRHELPVSDYIFESEIKEINFQKLRTQVNSKLKDFKTHEIVGIYVTGFTPALTTVISYCHDFGINLILYHHDKTSNGYIQQYLSAARFADIDDKFV